MKNPFQIIRKIEYSPYVLHSIQKYRRKREGVLLKIDFGGYFGYADCHPWPEIGDDPLHIQLQRLSLKTPTPLASQSMMWAYIDAKARLEKKLLLENLKIPKSHFLILQLDEASHSLFQQGLEEGFDRFKIKINTQTIGHFDYLEKILKDCQNFTHIKLRLDLNEHFNDQEFESFFQKLEPYQNFIDFFEDPFPYHQEKWKSYFQRKIPLACDLKGNINPQENEIPIVIVKPARYSLNDIQKIRNSEVVLTSYVSHPLEQVTAAYAAAKFWEVNPEMKLRCGLLSHKIYQENAFSQRLNQSGPEFKPVEGTGFGFDDLLEKQKWIKLWTLST